MLTAWEYIWIALNGLIWPLIMLVITIIYENYRRKMEIKFLMKYIEKREKEIKKWGDNLPDLVITSLKNSIYRKAGHAGAKLGEEIVKGSDWLSRMAKKVTEKATVNKIGKNIGIPKEYRGELGAVLGEAVDGLISKRKGERRQGKKNDQDKNHVIIPYDYRK